jgi:hypothetical protein
MNRIFVPITCAVCHHYSAVSFPKLDLRQRLANDTAIEFQCVYDGTQWDATPAERALMVKLLSENDVVDRAPPLLPTTAAVANYSLPA